MADENDQFEEQQPSGDNAGESDEGGESAEADAPVSVSSEGETAAGTAAAPEEPVKNWYIIHTYSGFENKVAESLRTRSEAFGFAHRIAAWKCGFLRS